MDIPVIFAQPYEHLRDSPHLQQAPADLFLHGLCCSGIFIIGPLSVFCAVFTGYEFQQVDHNQGFVVRMVHKFLYLFTSRRKGFRVFLLKQSYACGIIYTVVSMLSSHHQGYSISGRALLKGSQNLFSEQAFALFF